MILSNEAVELSSGGSSLKANSKMSKNSSFLSLLACLFLGVVIPAAATTVEVHAGMLSSPQATVAGMSTTDFNDGSIPSNFAFTGNAGVVSGSRQWVYLQPANDPTDYAYVGPGGSITETLGAAGVGVNYFGLYWGSPDQYNSLTFTDTDGNKLTYGMGGTPMPTFVDWQGNADSYVEFYITGLNWVSVTFASTTPAFEFDNVTAGLMAAPEPASMAIFGLGLLVVGLGAARRNRLA